MKKVLWLIVCLMTMVVSVNAQNDDVYGVSKVAKTSLAPINDDSANNNGWVILTHEADELIGNDEYKSISYSVPNVGSVILWDNENKKFRIVADDVFDSEVTKWNFGYKSLFTAIVGYYDINGKLLEKTSCLFEIGANHRQGNSIRNNWGVNEAKTIIPYLREKRGFVRIVAPLSGTNGKFDIKVPCLNN
jgi:hypothetical protein